MPDAPQLTSALAVERGIAPPYDRAAVTPGIVHLGVGNFHRAHQAAYVDAILPHDPNWGIIGVNLRSATMATALAPQDNLYTLAVRDGDQTETRLIGSILSLLHAENGADNVVEVIAAPTIRLVTLTVTEKAYCRAAGGGLDVNHPDISHDLNAPDAPRTMPGVLVAALKQRKAAGRAGLTLLSCDNLPDNGKVLARVVDEFANTVDPDLAVWIAENVNFPCSMVDRIVPATTQDDSEAITALTGYVDARPVMTEPFCQWVIEDKFANGRPPLDQVGVTFTDDVTPFETMKLRLLNGAHSTLAYLGYHAGFKTVAAAMENSALAGLVREMMEREIAPTLAPNGTDYAAHIDQLLVRFRNSALNHATLQIAMDGSEKIPQRLLATIRERRAAGLPHARLNLALAGWVRHATGQADSGAYQVDDPLAEAFQALARTHMPDVARFAEALFEDTGILGETLSGDGAFRAEIARLAALIFAKSPLAAIAELGDAS